jgi:hypothetical protein
MEIHIDHHGQIPIHQHSMVSLKKDLDYLILINPNLFIEEKNDI